MASKFRMELIGWRDFQVSGSDIGIGGSRDPQLTVDHPRARIILENPDAL
jgi:hypothetical protein